MDFRFTDEQEQFRSEIRQFLKEEMPADWPGRQFIFMSDEEWLVARDFDRRMGKKGWLTIAWPRRYGGQERTPIEQLVFSEEMGYSQAPNGGGSGHGPMFVGPTIIHYGDEETRERFLPPISTGEEIWCQGFSEPIAGSDLAAMETGAVRDGDDYVVNGMKHLVGQGQRAGLCILAARTDPEAPKHKGVSLLLVDMKSPGVRVEPMRTLPEFGAQWRIIMEDVRVPKRRLLGEENRGFYQMMTTMDLERNRIRHVADTHRVLDDVCRHVRATGLWEPVTRHKLAERKIEARVAIMLNYRIAWLQGEGSIPNAEASIGKLVSEEFRRDTSVTLMEVLGLSGQLGIEAKHAPFRGGIEDYYLGMVQATVVGGTSEVQRNVIATRGLGLPR